MKTATKSLPIVAMIERIHTGIAEAAAAGYDVLDDYRLPDFRKIAENIDLYCWALTYERAMRADNRTRELYGAALAAYRASIGIDHPERDENEW